MGGMFSYTAVVAKTKAMKGKMVKPQEYEKMAEMDSVTEVVAYLKSHPAYAPIFAQVNENDMHREDVEGLFQRAIYKDFTKIYAFSGIEQRKFLDIYYIRYEIAILKKCLRMIFDNREVEQDLSEYASFFGKRSTLDVVKLSEARTLTEFVESLKGTIFYQALKKMEDSKEATLFDYENALNLFYMNRMWKQFEKHLKKQDLQIVQEIYGKEIELLNQEWIYRAETYYHMDRGEINKFLIPIGNKIKDKEVKAVKKQDAEKIMERLHQVLNRKFPNSIICIENYLYKKEQEVDRLTTLIECVRYQLSLEETRKYIT